MLKVELGLARRDDMNKHLPEISNGGGLLHDDCVSLRNTALQITIIDIRGFSICGGWGEITYCRVLP